MVSVYGNSPYDMELLGTSSSGGGSKKKRDNKPNKQKRKIGILLPKQKLTLQKKKRTFTYNPTPMNASQLITFKYLYWSGLVQKLYKLLEGCRTTLHEFSPPDGQKRRLPQKEECLGKRISTRFVESF